MTGFTVVHRVPEADALLAALATAIVTGDGHRPDNGGFPGQDSTADFTPYVVMWPGVVMGIDGTVADPFADTVSEYQISAYGITAAQSRFAADKARDVILGQHLTVPNRSVQLVTWETSRATERDDDVQPPIYTTIDIYAIHSTPA